MKEPHLGHRRVRKALKPSWRRTTATNAITLTNTKASSICTRSKREPRLPRNQSCDEAPELHETRISQTLPRARTILLRCSRRNYHEQAIHRKGNAERKHERCSALRPPAIKGISTAREWVRTTDTIPQNRFAAQRRSTTRRAQRRKSADRNREYGKRTERSESTLPRESQIKLEAIAQTMETSPSFTNKDDSPSCCLPVRTAERQTERRPVAYEHQYTRSQRNERNEDSCRKRGRPSISRATPRLSRLS